MSMRKPNGERGHEVQGAWYDPEGSNPRAAGSRLGDAVPRSLSKPRKAALAATGPSAGPEPEWRQLTFMYCDLVDSTTLVQTIGAEKARDVRKAALGLIKELAEDAQGYVAGYFGDGAFVYFGYPQARENDATAAIKAAIKIVEEAAELLIHDYRPRFRIGIATGNVLIEEIQASGAAEIYVTGDAPNLAERLQRAADAGTIYISSETQQLAERRRKLDGIAFNYVDRGRLSLKGFRQEIQAYQVLGETVAEGRFETLRGAAVSPMIGRHKQLKELCDRWQSAKKGKGQVVLLSGEPGVGKSRLTMKLSEEVANDPHTRLRYFCSPSHQGSPFQPVITQIERVANIVGNDDPSSNMDKLDRLLLPGGSHAEDVLLIADLLSVLPKDQESRLPAAPKRRREKTVQALLRHLRSLAERQPVLITFEDVHWSDPSTLELLDLVIEHIPKMRVLLIVTFRPEFQKRWSKPHVNQIELVPLADDQCIELIEAIAGKGRLSPEDKQEILKSAEGIPLVVEELAQGTVELGKVPKAEDRPILRNLLQARLYHFTRLRAVLQIGAVIGREFSYELLRLVAGKPEDELGDALEQLSKAGLLQCRRSSRETTYLFKHALLQQEAYNSLVSVTRYNLHRRIVDCLIRHFPETLDSRPDLLAHHCAEANMIEDAAGYWAKAARYALSRSANVEAIGWANRGLKVVEQLAEGELRYRLELDLCTVLTRAYITKVGYTSQDTVNTVERARRLCDLLGEPEQLAGVLNNQWVCPFIRGELNAALKRAKEILKLGKARKKRVMTVLGYRSLGLTYFALGKFTQARRHLELGLARYRPADQDAYARLALEDVHVLMLAYLSFVLTYLGHFDKARVARDKTFTGARAVKQAYSMAHALHALALTKLLTNAPEDMIGPLDELEKLNEEHALFYYVAFVPTYRGWAFSELGRTKEGVALIESGVETHCKTGSRLYEPEFRRWLACAYLRAGQYDKGLAELDHAAEIAKQTGSLGDEGEWHRVRAELLAARGDQAGAETAYRAALKAANRHKAKLWTLRAATGLARLLNDQGKRPQARTVLKGVYRWFTEGFDTPVLKDARSLLDQLG